MAIDNAFSSSTAIRDNNRELFVGRKEELGKAYTDAKKTGALVAIYGETGVGKSSFVWQLLGLLSGKNELVDLYKLDFKLDAPKNCIYIECYEDLADLKGLLRRLIFRNTNDINSMSEMSLLELYREVNHHKSLDNNLPLEVSDDNILDYYFQIIRHITKESKKELIICIDEFDRLPSFILIRPFLCRCYQSESLFNVHNSRVQIYFSFALMQSFVYLYYYSGRIGEGSAPIFKHI